MLSRWLRSCVIAALFVLLPAASALAEKRVALIIGNSNYTNVQKLPNPTRDASAIAALLKDAGFDVVDAEANLTNVAMRRAVRKFTAIARDATIAVVYYAGHGIEVGGINYLIPIDAQLGSDVDVEDETLSLDRITKMLEPVNRLRLIILDACRENPFVRSMSRTVATRSINRGLAEIGPTTPDTLVAFAAKAGSTAEDGTGAHSPFTAALLNNLTIPGLDVGLALRRVRDQVMKDTGGKQEPFIYGSLGGSLVALKPASAAPPVAAQAAAPAQAPRQPADTAVRDYEFAERIGTRQAWDLFLATHSANPAGKYFVELARAARDKAIAAEAREKATTQRGDDTRNKTELAAISPPPQPARPERPRQTPAIPLEALAQDFLVNYVRRSQDSLAELLDYARRNYASEVDYYGKRNTTQQVVEDQQNYATRWPERGFRLKPGTARIVCDKPNASCDLSGEIDFRAANPVKHKVSMGVATFHLRVRFTSAGPKIYFENGDVISRRN